MKKSLVYIAGALMQLGAVTAAGQKVSPGFDEKDASCLSDSQPGLAAKFSVPKSFSGGGAVFLNSIYFTPSSSYPILPVPLVLELYGWNASGNRVLVGTKTTDIRLSPSRWDYVHMNVLDDRIYTKLEARVHVWTSCVVVLTYTETGAQPGNSK